MRRAVISAILAVILCVTASSAFKAQALSLSAETAVLVDSDGGVLFARGADKRMQPASMTKIMTAILVIEECGLDGAVTVGDASVGTEGSSAYLSAGEVFSVEELLYALLLQSANDAACALAEYCGGITSFVDRMNGKAKELGLINTHFTNPHGLSDKEHYSTAYDVASLLLYCMKNPTFRKISGATEYVIAPNGHRYGRYFTNHNKLLFTCDGVCGGKTGYTVTSGRCLCSYYEKDGVTLCAVTMNAPRDWDDHKALYEYGRSLYKEVTLDPSGTYILHVVGGVTDTVECTVDGSVTVTVRADATEIKKAVYMRRFEYAPVYAGQKVGCVVFLQDDKIIYTAPLYADNKAEAEKSGIGDFLKWKK